MRTSKRVVAEQFIPTSTTPPSDVGIYRVGRTTLGVTGKIRTFDPATKTGSFVMVESDLPRFGTKAAAQMVPSICDTGLYKPALHVFHPSLTKVGTWVTGPTSISVGAFTSAGGSYSVTAGDTISGAVSGRAIGIRWYEHE